MQRRHDVAAESEGRPAHEGRIRADRPHRAGSQRLGRRVLPDLAAAAQVLEDEDWVVRWSAARALGALGASGGEPLTGTVPALAKVLKDPDSRVCEAAAFALEQMGPAAVEAVPALGASAADSGEEYCEVIDTESEASQKIQLGSGWTVRWVSTRALGVVGADQEASIPPLLDALEDEEWQVRGVAALALGQHEKPGDAAVRALVTHLNDEQAPVRKAAAMALGTIGRPALSAVPVLRDAVEDEDASVRRAAEEALDKLAALNEESA